MNADSTLFSDNDLSEPDYSGQVVATSVIGSGSKYSYVRIHEYLFEARDTCPACFTGKYSAPHNERRVFKRVDSNSSRGLWEDRTGERFLFSDLRDIVIINRGVKL